MNNMLQRLLGHYFAIREPRLVSILGGAPRISHYHPAPRGTIIRLPTLEYSSACSARTRRLQAFEARTASHPPSFQALPRHMNTMPHHHHHHRRSVRGRIFDSMMDHPFAWLLITLCVSGAIAESYKYYRRRMLVYTRTSYVRSRWEGWKAGRRQRRAEKRERREKAAEEKARGTEGRKWRDYFWKSKEEKGDGKEAGISKTRGRRKDG